MFAFKVLKKFQNFLKYKATFQGKSVILEKIYGQCIAFRIDLKLQFVGNKAKCRISKLVLQENKAHQFF